jgi:hypothetical protein
MTVLTDEQQAFTGPVGITGMPTHRAGFACIVGIHLDRHTLDGGILGRFGEAEKT